jgi:hypothetical protein
MTYFLLCSIIYLQLYAPKATYLLPVVPSVSNCIHTDCVKEKPVKLWSLKNGLMLGEWWFAYLLGIHSDARGMTLCQCYDVLKVEGYWKVCLFQFFCELLWIQISFFDSWELSTLICFLKVISRVSHHRYQLTKFDFCAIQVFWVFSKYPLPVMFKSDIIISETALEI